MTYRDDRGKETTTYRLQRIERLDENLFVVCGASRIRKVARVNRNMVVMRHQKKRLTLVNPIRLDEDGEKQLLKLGTIDRIIRLAPEHGMSHDAYYVEHFPRVRRWAPAESEDPTVPVHRLITEDDGAILPACHVFCFRHTARPECALVIQQNVFGNLLVTADALQSHRDNPYVNALVRAKYAARGMMQGTIVIPPSWLKANSPKYGNRRAIKADFEGLLRFDFQRCIASSGVMAHESAKEMTVLAVEKAFPPLWN